MQGISILGSTLLATGLMAFFPFVRGWWQSFLSSKDQALLLSLVMLAMFLGVSSSIDTTALTENLVGSRRFIRVLIFSALFLASAFIIMQNPSYVRASGKPLNIMLFYAFWAILSTSYSINPFLSSWKGFEVLTLVLIIIALSGKIKTLNNLKQLLDSLNLISLFLVLTVLIGLLLYPHEAIHGSESTGQLISYLGVRGLVPAINPATQGALAAILFISALSYLLTPEKETRKNIFGLWLIIIISSTLIILAHSRTQILACSLASLVLLYFTRRYLLAFFALSVGSIAIIATSDTVLSYILRGQTEGQFLTMTGRTTHWADVINIATDSFFFGRGFYSAQRVLFGSGSVDNTYLECFVGLGIIGLIVLVTPVFMASLSFYKTRPRSKKFTQINTLWLSFAGIFTILVIRSFTSPTFASMHPMMLYYLMTLLASSSLIKFQLNANEGSLTDKLHATSNTDGIDKLAIKQDRIIRKRRTIR